MEAAQVEALQPQLQNAYNFIHDQQAVIRAYHRALIAVSQGRNLAFISQGGSRIQAQQRMIFRSSRCVNCESKFHVTRHCKSHPILRNTDWTPSSATADTSYQYSYLRFMENISAGEVISFWHNALHWDRNFSRNEVQCLFSVFFFNRVCWHCHGSHTDRHCSSLLAGLLAGGPYPDRDNCVELRQILGQFIHRNPTLRTLNYE